MKQLNLILVIGLSLFFIYSESEASRKPNVVFIIADDLNDSINGFGGHPQAHTPNLNRLAKMGVRFTNAHCNAPMCAPSRPSLLSGIYPHRSGMVDGRRPFRSFPILEKAILFPEYMINCGYQAYSGGKLFHGIDKDNTVFGASSANEMDGGYIGPIANFGPYPWDGKTLQYKRPSRNILNPHYPWFGEKSWTYGHGRLSKLPKGSTSWVYCDSGFKGIDGKNGGVFKYNNTSDRSLMPDEIISDWGCKLLKGISTFSYNKDLKKISTEPMDDRPFFLGLGFIKSHFALYSPDEFFDAVLNANQISEEEIILPWSKSGQVAFGDLDDIPIDLRETYSAARNRYKVIQEAGTYHSGGITNLLREITLSYLAAVNEVDTQVGKILDALEESNKLEDTIIIFTSDHGYNHGDKESFFKNLLWEKSTRIPLIIVNPYSEFNDSRGKECEWPVSLIDIYPTIVDLCGLKKVTGLDGFSLRKLISEPESDDWEGPKVALTAIKGQHSNKYSVRSKDFRYSLGDKGGEELYDHKKDPWEWYNLAKKDEYESIKAKLRNELLSLIER